jgi:hypothetical protein
MKTATAFSGHSGLRRARRRMRGFAPGGLQSVAADCKSRFDRYRIRCFLFAGLIRWVGFGFPAAQKSKLREPDHDTSARCDGGVVECLAMLVQYLNVSRNAAGVNYHGQHGNALNLSSRHIFRVWHIYSAMQPRSGDLSPSAVHVLLVSAC